MNKLNSPTAIVLMLTNRCNLSCKFCGTSELSPKSLSVEISKERWVSLLEELATLNTFYLTFTGGEIFVRKDIFDILETASALFPNKIKINTNGTLFSESDVDRLKMLNFDVIGTSIDGTWETHNRLRGKGNYEKTLQFVKWMIKRDMDFEVCFVPTRLNYNEFPKVIEELSGIGVKRFDYNSLSPEGKACENYNELKISFPEEYEDFTNLVKEINKTYHVSFPLKYEKYLILDRKYQQLKSKNVIDVLEPMSIWTCSAGKTSCAVLPDGWLIPCTAFADFKGKNIKTMSFKEAWETSDWETIFALEKIKVPELPGCKNCNYNKICGAGCRGVNYQFTGDLLASDINCPFQ